MPPRSSPGRGGRLRIPVLYIKDKQCFRKEGGVSTLAGKPLDVARELKEKGAKLIHFVDQDALNGNGSNLDIYDNLTYFVNVEVECAPADELVKKLLSFKCRVVLAVPCPVGVSRYKEKKLLVAKVPESYGGGEAGVAGFHDVILEGADDTAVEHFASMGKRVIIYGKDEGKVKKEKKSVFGVISS